MEWDDPSYSRVGNIQLSRILGAETRLDYSSFSIGHKATLAKLLKDVEERGGKGYYIPAGASDHPLGGLGFARWAFELEAQERDLGLFFDTVVVCAVTGSTFAGMIAGFKLAQKVNGSRKRRVLGIDASAKPDETRAQVLKIARQTAEKIGLGEGAIEEGDVELDERFHGGVYGVPDQKTKDAIRFAAEVEGMLTDPVYEGKSMAALMDIVRAGEVENGSHILYVHLGGQMALSAYSGMLERGSMAAKSLYIENHVCSLGSWGLLGVVLTAIEIKFVCTGLKIQPKKNNARNVDLKKISHIDQREKVSSR